MSYKVRKHEEFTLFENEGGAVLGMRRPRVIEQDGYVFKDLAGTGELLPYEDWRLDARTRAEDLAGRLSVEEIAGLMLYSSHQLVPFRSMGPFAAHYDGKSYEEAGVPKWALTDEQKTLICEDNIRHILLMKVDDADTSARWSNALQSLAEEQPWGIPVNLSSDPRHGASGAGAEYKSAGVDVSKWPEGLGMTATFSPELCKKYTEAVSKEYRALGITTALGPQVDLATEPRWMRYEDTFGGEFETTRAMAKAVCDGLQTTEGAPDGWGRDSIVAMAKHWPGGGTGEGGRDAHYAFGKCAVYPGGKFEQHMRVFTEGALSLDGPTGQVGSIMPYYTISWDQDQKNKENVGNSYSEYLIHDLLRETYGYDGVLCTDWGITGDPAPVMDSFGSRCYGVEQLSEAERHLRIILNGVDQFGGNDAKAPIIEAYRIGCERYGEPVMRARMEQSAVRLLTNLFRVGLFENPYLDPEESSRIVGAPEFVANGMEAQRASVVLLKNKNRCLPLARGIKVYIPDRRIRARKNFFRGMDEEQVITPVTEELIARMSDGVSGCADKVTGELEETANSAGQTSGSVEQAAGNAGTTSGGKGQSERAASERLFYLADTPEEADAAIVFVESPLSDAYSEDDARSGGNGYLPLTLQYRPYTANAAREHSIAGGDFREPSADRGYRGKTNTAANEADLDNILETKRVMGDKPVIVCMRLHNPAVVAEFEPAADGIFAEFGVQKEAVLDLIFGNAKPAGRLPVILPADMETVERHAEDVFDDITPYTDEEGQVYAFGYGLRYEE